MVWYRCTSWEDCVGSATRFSQSAFERAAAPLDGRPASNSCFETFLQLPVQPLLWLQRAPVLSLLAASWAQKPVLDCHLLSRRLLVGLALFLAFFLFPQHLASHDRGCLILGGIILAPWWSSSACSMSTAS